MRVLLFILFFPFSFSGHDDGKELLNMALDRCEHLESLEDYRDILSRYGMTDKLPLACPLKEKFRISSTYGGRIHPLTKKRSFHSGIDMAVELAAPVYATASGTVTFAGRKGGYGRCVAGSTGRSTGYHLHYEIRKYGKTIKPYWYGYDNQR